MLLLILWVNTGVASSNNNQHLSAWLWLIQSLLFTMERKPSSPTVSYPSGKAITKSWQRAFWQQSSVPPKRSDLPEFDRIRIVSQEQTAHSRGFLASIFSSYAECRILKYLFLLSDLPVQHHKKRAIRLHRWTCRSPEDLQSALLYWYSAESWNSHHTIQSVYRNQRMHTSCSNVIREVGVISFQVTFDIFCISKTSTYS